VTRLPLYDYNGLQRRGAGSPVREASIIEHRLRTQR
jgi:hypothetical protein